ncbi:hypothetical protein KC219_22290, partial [Mycobacterium tuberculosis]|nr:hypothetical protein [Mycobacterium tuberculosis]
MGFGAICAQGKSGGYWQFYQHSVQAQVTERQHLDWAWAGLPVMGSVQVRFEFGASLAHCRLDRRYLAQRVE